MLDWIYSHPLSVWWLAALSALMFVGGLVLMPILVARMHSDYFLRRNPTPTARGGRHRAIRLSALIVKNSLGLVLLIAGLAMLVLPGQGIITILVGISLLNFPGKHRLELVIVRQGPVLQAINWIRTRAGRPPLRLPDPDRSEPG
jgi:hypothetical protein